MKIARDTVASFHYRAFDESGAEIDSSHGHPPSSILVGHGNVVPGVDEGLVGHEAGERFELLVPPELGYGLRQEGLTERLSKKYFEHPRQLKAGERAALQTRQGVRWVTVLKVGHSMVDVDFNHPMAGRTLRFELEITEVRAATPEEIAHGHAHGAGGHHH